jgi:hypothetical protein
MQAITAKQAGPQLAVVDWDETSIHATSHSMGKVTDRRCGTIRMTQMARPGLHHMAPAAHPTASAARAAGARDQNTTTQHEQA